MSYDYGDPEGYVTKMAQASGAMANLQAHAPAVTAALAQMEQLVTHWRQNPGISDLEIGAMAATGVLGYRDQTDVVLIGATLHHLRGYGPRT